MKPIKYSISDCFRVEYATPDYMSGRKIIEREVYREDVSGRKMSDEEAIEHFGKVAEELNLVLRTVQRVIYWRPVEANITAIAKKKPAKKKQGKLAKGKR